MKIIYKVQNYNKNKISLEHVNVRQAKMIIVYNNNNNNNNSVVIIQLNSMFPGHVYFKVYFLFGLMLTVWALKSRLNATFVPQMSKQMLFVLVTSIATRTPISPIITNVVFGYKMALEVLHLISIVITIRTIINSVHRLIGRKQIHLGWHFKHFCNLKQKRK